MMRLVAPTRVATVRPLEIRVSTEARVLDQISYANEPFLARIAIALERIADAVENRTAEIMQLNPSPRDNGREVLKKLLPAISGAIGSELFMTKEVLANPVFLKLAGNRGAKKLGNLFSRFVNVPIDDRVLLRIGNDRGGAALWTVQKVLPSLQSLKVSNKPTL